MIKLETFNKLLKAKVLDSETVWKCQGLQVLHDYHRENEDKLFTHEKHN